MTHPLLRTSPETQGIPSSAILAFVEGAEQTLQHLHSFMLLRHGAVVAEGWWHPYRSQSPHMLFSLSKSFASSAVGLAVAEGRLSLADPVLKFFPQQAPRQVSANLAAMQVRHLLSMSTGHDQDVTERAIRQRDPIKGFLALPVEHVPGTHFVYNSAATFMLSAILQKLSGQTLLEYLTPRLLEPLGIQGATWESHPNGVNFGGWGLSVKTEDIARFGQLYLQGGQWQGQQLLPAVWVEQATAKQVSNGTDALSDWAQGYGFQFWRCRPAGVYRGDGAFGQYCIVMPEQDAVLAITAGLGDMQPPLRLVWQTLLPAMGPAALPEDVPAAAELTQRLSHLALATPPGEASVPLAAQFSGRRYAFQPNYATLHSLSLDFTAQRLTYRLLGGGSRRGTHTLDFAFSAWVDGLSALSGSQLVKTSASGAWTAPDTFRLVLCQFETPFIMTLDFTFTADQVTLHPRTNVGFGPTEMPALVGKAVS